MKKVQKQKFTVEQKKKYHTERITSPKVSENQRRYSRNWLDGFTDEYADFNLKGCKKELNDNQELIKGMETDILNRKLDVKVIKEYNKMNLVGYINGATSKLNKKGGN